MWSSVETFTVGVLLILSAPALNGKSKNEITIEKTIQVSMPPKDRIQIKIEKDQGRTFEDQLKISEKENQRFNNEQQLLEVRQKHQEVDCKPDVPENREPELKDKLPTNVEEDQETVLEGQLPTIIHEPLKTTEKKLKYQLHLEMPENREPELKDKLPTNVEEDQQTVLNGQLSTEIQKPLKTTKKKLRYQLQLEMPENREPELKNKLPTHVEEDQETVLNEQLTAKIHEPLKTTEKKLKNQILLEMRENWGTDRVADWGMQTRDIWRSNKTSKNVNFSNVLPGFVSTLMGSFKMPGSICDGFSKCRTMVSNIFKTLLEFCGKEVESKTGGQSPPLKRISSATLEHSGFESPGSKSTTRQPKLLEGEFLVADMIENIHIIPGSGEFVYDTKIQKKKGTSASTYNHEENINQNNDSGKSDAMLSLENLKKDLPNVKWVSVVVNWFADNININYCQIYPAVEFQNDFRVIPDDWQVGRINRDNARLISRDGNGNLRYGGTISDAALIRFIRELHRRGYNVMLYPMIFLDTENKEWRGRLTGPPNSISAFFSGQYNGFIKHYCNIAKQTKVEGFIIGSEFEELTKIKDWQGNYPAVTELVKLAKHVKSHLGGEVTVTYAANWSEYHSHGGWYNMDDLWSSNYIDVVGIDAYFPLTDGREPSYGYSVQNVIDGWSSGEGYDYFLDYSKSRPEKIKYEHSKWAWKNVEKWWSEAHINPNGSPTKWQPKMKKVWFTEYGFPSVDGCTNEPYVFVDGSSKESRYPRYSSKEVSFRSQRIAIEGTIKKWQNSEMVEKMFLWTWDARPYPYFPNLQDVWGDCKNWETGHWIQGKIGVPRIQRKPSASGHRGVESPRYSPQQPQPTIPLREPVSPLRKPERPRFTPLEHNISRSPQSTLRELISPERKSESPERKKSEALADQIKNIVIIPGPGEFVYNTEVRKTLAIMKNSDGRYVTRGIPKSNNNKAENNDVLVTLGLLKEDLPNVEWVLVTVNWFADNLNIKDCQIYPAVESLNDLRVTPDYWQVGHISKSNVRLLSRGSDGLPRHSGTVCDTDLIRLIRALHSKGYKVMLHPALLLDTENKEWRGKFEGPPDSIANFFGSQYNGFIKHYVNIAEQTKVEGFIIGSEFDELTKIKDTRGNYPAVSELVKLAQLVKSDLGTDVTVTYGANWSEYHSYRGWYNMDELWSSDYIDVVGFNGYFPLTDGPEPPSGYSVQDIVNGWSSGEGFQYFLDYSKSRPEETKYYYNDSRWAWKNIEKWWSEFHVNPNGMQTKWRPKMKKIWFTAYGFASVKCCTNEPFVFVDGNNKESEYPRYSNKEVSFRSQRVAIEGTLRKWANSEMVEKMFLWAWGVGPVPYVPQGNEIRSVSNNWRTDHRIQGKIGKISGSWPWHLSSLERRVFWSPDRTPSDLSSTLMLESPTTKSRSKKQ